MLQEMRSLGKKAREASQKLRLLPAGVKNKALEEMARALLKETSFIIQENQKDMKQGQEKGLSGALLDRLLLTEDRIQNMAEGVQELVNLPDPIGEISSMWTRPNGLQVGRMRVPLGVIGMIYEARPNVTVDAAGLCLKTSNAILLRGGSEALHSNICLARIISRAAEEQGIPAGAIQLVETAEREAVNVMLKMNEYLDLLIPRGGKGLIQAVLQSATVPVLETGEGNCHTYVDEHADLEMALRIAVNAKVQRPGVCNAMETLLVHEKAAPRFLPEFKVKMEEAGVELRGCPAARDVIPGIKEATGKDWETEYLDLILAVKVVSSLEEAVSHINRFGTGHSEAIVTNHYQHARDFLQQVDAASVYVNTSTRFTDGFQYGFGAEIGISTQKLHARGPMGPQQLTTCKYIIMGSGQIRE